MDGSSAKSAATAEVIMLFGPPTRQPMKANRSNRIVTGISFMYSAKTHSRGHRTPAYIEGGWKKNKKKKNKNKKNKKKAMRHK